MAHKDEREERRAILRSLKEGERSKLRSALPLSIPSMKALFDFVDKRLREAGCDDTLRYTAEYLKMQGVPPEPTLKWLRENGGYCDCEMIANAEERFQFCIQSPIVRLM